MEKPSRIILAQADHISGELLGFAIEKLMELGAGNVHVVPTITKKNRPGYMMFIDVTKETEEAVAQFLARELKISGYQRIDAAHVYQRVEFEEKTIRVVTKAGEFQFELKVKIVGDPADPASIDVEHDALTAMAEEIKTASGVPVTELKAMIESQLRNAGDEIVIEV